MSSVPRSWARALDAAGVVAVLSAIPLWSAVHPGASVVSLCIGALVGFARSTEMRRNARTLGWLLRIAGVVLSVSAVAVWLESGPLLAIPGFTAGLVLTVIGSMITPTRQTGADFARFTMESTYEDAHMVKPPQLNVGDPLEGDDGRFLGR